MYSGEYTSGQIIHIPFILNRCFLKITFPLIMVVILVWAHFVYIILPPDNIQSTLILVHFPKIVQHYIFIGNEITLRSMQNDAWSQCVLKSHFKSLLGTHRFTPLSLHVFH